MKKLYILSFALISSLSIAQISTSFPGTGSLNANGWTTHSGATPGQLTLSTGSLSYTGLTSSANRVTLVAGNTEDVNKASTAALTGVVYYSAIINVLNVTGLNPNTATGDYFLAGATTSGSTGVSGLPARIYVRSGATADTFNIGVLNNSGGTVAPSYVATDYPVNTPIFVVVKYDTAGNTASLFINPTIGGTEGTANATNATGTNTAAQIAAMAIRQGGNATAGTGNVEIDELRLNTTWADVTSAALKVNQNAIAGLSIFPNPVKNGVFYINTDANAERTVTVFDVLGKQVLNTTTSESAINVSNLTAGVYMVQISEEGNTATKKLVIE